MKLTPATAAAVRRLALDVVLLDGEQDAAPDLSDMARRAKALLDGPLWEKKSPPRPKAPGRTREERREADDARESAGKDAARKRSGGRCEWHTDGRRCSFPATDGHHVLGGRWKRDMEALPNGDGFMDECRLHHELFAHGEDRIEALGEAKEHAIRIGSKGLLRHVEAAIRRWEARHTPSVAVRIVEVERG